MRFVAIGDSLTEGVGDPRPDGSLRGWADRLAEGLAAHHGEVEYANLAVRGLRAADVRATQLAPSLALEPDLVAAVVGMNDLVRPGLDLDAFGRVVDELFASLRSGVSSVLTATIPDVGAVLPIPTVVRRALSRRVARLNARIARLADAHDVVVLDLARIPAAVDPSRWSPDRLHPNAAGHAMLAVEALRVLDVATDVEVEVLAGASAATDGSVRWVRHDLGPWLWRRITGRSSADACPPKSPTYRTVSSPPGS